MNVANHLIGQRVIIRSTNSGVHFGTLAATDGQATRLVDARRLWYWLGAFTLNAVANHGVGDGSKLSEPVTEIVVMETIEIIPCTDASATKIAGMPAHQP